VLPFATATIAAESSTSVNPAAIVVGFAFGILGIIAYWRIFAKTGNPGWTSIIPILNSLVLLKAVKRPLWWLILLIIPFVGIVFLIIVLNDLSKAFGHGVGFTLLLIFLTPIGLLVLAFGGSQYQLAKEPLL